MHNRKKGDLDVTGEPKKEPSSLQVISINGLLSHLHTVRVLLWQGIAIRGHYDEESNIVQFNRDQARADKNIAALVK